MHHMASLHMARKCTMSAILLSHASTAYLEERKKKNNFVGKEKSNHIKEKNRCSA
jgi:hypothetical protein